MNAQTSGRSASLQSRYTIGLGRQLCRQHCTLQSSCAYPTIVCLLTSLACRAVHCAAHCMSSWLRHVGTN